MKTPPEFPLGIHRVSNMEKIDYNAGAAVVRKLLHTREVRQLLGNLLPEVLSVYAGKNRFKQFIARLVGKHLEKSLSRSGDIFEPREMQKLFEDDRFVEKCIAPLPDLVAGMFDILDTAAATIEGLETRDKRILFGDFLSRMADGRTGSLITRGCRILNDIHGDDPEFFTRTLEPGFRKWIEGVDFGELKETFENSATDSRAFIKMANDVMWEYPAKVVLLLSLIPSAVNMITEALDMSTERLNELPADLLTDVILSFIREIEGRPIAGLINQLTEIVRKIHTGSGLLGEPGAPQLPRVISGKIDEIADRIDPVVLWKARTALAETRATIDHAVSDAVNRNPALRQLKLIKGPEISNIRFKTWNRDLAHWDSLDDDEAAASVSKNLSAYDMQEIAEVANGVIRLFNRVGDRNPEIFPSLVRQFTDALDGYEVGEAARRLFSEAGDPARPLARAVVPGLVLWMADILKPADDEHEDAAAQARDALHDLFAREEV